MSLINKQQVGVYFSRQLQKSLCVLTIIAEVSTLLFMGDQLTVERERGFLKARVNSSCSSEALEGLQPAICNWHAEYVLLQVCSLPILEVVLIITFQCVCRLFTTGSISGALT